MTSLVIRIHARLWGAVFMNGQELMMREAETKQEHMLSVEDGSHLLLVWSLHYPELGNAVEIVTGLHTASFQQQPRMHSFALMPTLCELSVVS